MLCRRPLRGCTSWYTLAASAPAIDHSAGAEMLTRNGQGGTHSEKARLRRRSVHDGILGGKHGLAQSSFRERRQEPKRHQGLPGRHRSRKRNWARTTGDTHRPGALGTKFPIVRFAAARPPCGNSARRAARLPTSALTSRVTRMVASTNRCRSSSVMKTFTTLPPQSSSGQSISWL